MGSYHYLLVVVIATICHVNAQPSVVVEQGRLQGKTVMFSENEFININRELDVYEGVPFAEPPVRFEYPVKKASWGGSTWDATYMRPACYQQSRIIARDGLQISEDCLYLNMYVPHGISNAAVMVWIHGGGWAEDTGSSNDYIGEPLSAVGDVIQVNINYRLNSFGFVTTGDDVIPGNYGMLDQIEALRWVKQNIAAFGGDPNKVTIFGESGGAYSVSYLLLTKLSEGLFQQAIMQSGSSLNPGAFQDSTQGRQVAFQIGAQLGCNAADSTSLRQCLRAATAEALYAAGEAIGFSPAPCIDNYFLTDRPANLIARQEFHRVPVLLGTNAEEGTLVVLRLHPEYIGLGPQTPFIPEIEFKTVMGVLNGGNPIVVASVDQQYLDWSIQDQDGLNYFEPFVAVTTDRSWPCFADIEARAHAAVGDNVFVYQMTHRPTVSWLSNPQFNPTWLGAGHQEDLNFVFGVPFMRVQVRAEMSDAEKVFSVQFMRFWSTFAKTGSPSMSTDPNNELYWPTYTIPDLGYKELDLTVATKRALKADTCNFWNDVVPKLRTFTGELPEVEKEWRTEFYDWKYEAMEDWQDAFNKYKAATNA